MLYSCQLPLNFPKLIEVDKIAFAADGILTPSNLIVFFECEDEGKFASAKTRAGDSKDEFDTYESSSFTLFIENFSRDTTELSGIMDKYVDIRFLEREISTNLDAIKKIANQIYNYALTQTGDQRKHFSHIAINFVEFAIGSVASVRQSVDKNSLTTITTSPIFILDLMEDFKRYGIYENLVSEFFSPPIKLDIGVLVDISNTGQ